MSIEAIDCQGLGGGLTLGMVQAGAKLVQKVEQQGDFGFAQCDDNRHLLGEDWDYVGGNIDQWPVRKVPLVFGNPPCSGFSMMSVRAGSGLNRSDRRGADNAINSCMRDFTAYAAMCDADVTVMESVPTAGKDGKAGGVSLMRELHRMMEETTGRTYTAYHVFHNAAGCGGSSIRNRYFLVLSRIPMGFTLKLPTAVPTLREVIGDLESLPLTMDAQRAVETPSWWVEPKWTGTITGHDITRETPHQRRVFATAEALGWCQGDPIEAVVARYFDEHGTFPEGWGDAVQDTLYYRPLRRAHDYNLVHAGEMTREEYEQKHRSPFPPAPPKPFQSGAYSTKRWHYDRAARVLTGGGLVDNLHPTLPRTFTYREAARIMGFPDSWKVDSYAPNSHNVFGKGVIVEVGRWIGRNVIDALEGGPGDYQGVQSGEREFVVNFTNDHKAVYNERTGERGDFRSPALKKEMEAR